MYSNRFGRLSLLIAAVLTGCGGGGNPVPPNSTVQTSIPDNGIVWDIAAPAVTPCVINPARYNDHTIAISVLDGNRSPLGNVDIRVVVDLAGNTYSNTPVLGLYDDFNANGVVNDPAELVSSNTSPAYTTKTDAYTGTKILLLRVNLSCPYRGNLHVYAGTAYKGGTIEVKVP